MRPDIERVYLQEILSQCTLAKQAIEDVRALAADAFVTTRFGNQSEQSTRF